MLHLAIICMVCAVLAPIEGTALTGVNNNKSNIFCHVDERDQRHRGKFFPGLYNVNVKNCFDCAEKPIPDRTHCIFYNKLNKECQCSRTLCSFKNKFPDRKKRNPDSQLDYTLERGNICRLFKNKGKMLVKIARRDAKKPEEPKHFGKLTAEERNKLRNLKRVGRTRNKRRIRKSHLDKVEIDDDLDMDKRIEKLVKRIALENMKTEENSVVSPITEPVTVTDVSTRLSEDSTKGIAFPFFNNIKQIFRFSKEYFNSKRDSQEKRDVTIPITTERNRNTRTESEDPKKSARLRRNVPRHFIHKNHNRLRGCPRALNTPNRVAFSAVKRKRGRRKRDHRHHRQRLDLSSKPIWPLFSQTYSSYKTDYNGYDSSTAGTQEPENKSVVTTVLPSFHNSSSINHINNFSTTNSETLTDRQGNDATRGSDKLDDYNSRNVFHHGFGKPIRQDVTKRYKSGHKRSGFPYDRKRLRSGRYLKIRHALRNYIHHNNDWRLRERILMERKKRCEAKCNNMPRKCWRSAPLLCIPYIRKGQDELLKYIIKTLQDMLGKPMPRKIDIFEKIKFKPCSKTPSPTCEDIMPGGESDSSSQTTATTSAPTTTTSKPTSSSTSPSPSPSTPLSALVLYETFPATESASSTTTCSSVETVTNCASSFTCTVQTNVCSSSTTTSPPPVSYPSSTTSSPSTSTTYASASQNTYAVLIIGPSTGVLPTAGSEPMATASGTWYGYSTETTLSTTTESSTQTPPQSQTQNSMTFIQITVGDDKSSESEISANTPSSNYPPTSTTSDNNFPKSPTNKVTPRALAQDSIAVSPHATAASTQEIRSPTTRNTSPWYTSESPLEKAEILTFTAVDCTSSSDPDFCYKYYQSLTPPSINEKPQLSNQRQQQDFPYNMLAYETDKTPTQHRPPTMGSGTTMPLEFDLSYNDNAKPCTDFCESGTITDYSSEPNPKDEKSLRDRNFVESHGRFRLGEDENLFPGDPFAYRYTEMTDRFLPKMMRPKFYRKKFPIFMRKSNRKLTPNYDYVDEPLSRNRKIYDERYDRYYSPEMSERAFDERLRKTSRKNQKRGKREIVYRDSYPESKNSDNYDYYPDDSNYNDQYPENLLLPMSEKNHWARKRDEDQNSSTPGTYALFSELAEIAALAPNEKENVSEESANTNSTESSNTTVANPQTSPSPQMGCINKLEGQKSGYDNSPNPTVSILSPGHTTTLKQIPATTSGEATTESSITTTLENKESTRALESNEVQKAQIVDWNKPDKELGSNHDLEAGEEQIITTLKTANIVKGPKKLFTKPAPKVYTKVYPDSLPNELETNETPTSSTTPKTDKTTVVQTLAAPDVRLQLLAVCEGYLEIVKLIKAQNQTLEEELDTDLSRYCENIISQSFNLQADNIVIKSKKPEKSSPSMTTTAQTVSANSNKLVSKRRSCDRCRAQEDGSSHQDLRAKVVVDILRSPIYKKDLAAYVDQNNFYPRGRKTKRMSSQNLKMDDRGMRKSKGRVKKDFSNSKVGLRNQRKKLRKSEEKFSKKKISEEEMELLHLLRQRKRALLSWLSDPKENEIKPNDLEETEYLDDDEYYTITADTTEDSGTITPKGDQETSESTTKTTFYTNDTIFPVYAKQFGYDRGGELREVEVLWRRVNEETHEKKVFKNMSVLALLLTSTMAPYMKRKESKLVGGNVYEAEEMSEIQPNRDNRAGFVDPSPSFKEKPVTTSLPPPNPSTTIYFVSFKPEFKQCCVTTTTLTTTSTTASSTTSSTQTTPTTTTTSTIHPTEQQTEFETVQPNNTSKRNQTYIFMRKPDPSTIVGSPPNSTKGHKNSTHRISRKLEIAKDFFQEYSIEFLNYAVYILPIMFTILFLMCCLCCFLQIINSRGGDRRKKKKKSLLCAEEDFDTTGDSDGEPKIKKKKKWKKSIKNGVDSENLENRRLRAFWNVLKMNSRRKQRGDIHDETSTPTEKRRSFLQFLKGKKEAAQPEELASLSYPPPCERDEISDEETRIRVEGNDINEEFDSEIKVPVRERTEVDERREIISLLEELKKIELENLEERKNKKSVCVQYMTQDEEKTVFKKPDIPSSYQVNKYFESDPFPDKRFPFREPNPEELHEDAQEFMELVPYEGEYIQRKSSSVRRSDIRVNRGGRCERFFKIFRRSGDGMNFTKSGTDNKSYTYTKYKNISTDTRDEFVGGTHRNADIDMNLSDDMLDNFPPPYSLQRNKQTDIVDEMENLKRQLNKKKNVRLKDNGVLCRL